MIAFTIPGERAGLLLIRINARAIALIVQDLLYISRRENAVLIVLGAGDLIGFFDW